MLAGLPPSTYLVAAEHDVLATDIESEQALGISFEAGASAAVSRLPKPRWCSAVESALEGLAYSADEWLEVGIRGDGTFWHCSVPLGRLPHLQAGLLGHGLRLGYITCFHVKEHDD